MMTPRPMYKVNKDLLIRNLHFLCFTSPGAGAGTSGGVGVVWSCSLIRAGLAFCTQHRYLNAEGQILQYIFHFIAGSYTVNRFPHLVFNLLHSLRRQTARGLRNHYLSLSSCKRLRRRHWSRRNRGRRGTGTPSEDLLLQSLILRLQASQAGGHVFHAHVNSLNRRQSDFAWS